MNIAFKTLDACPICQSDQIKSFLSTIDYAITQDPFELYQCVACEFVFTRNQPAPDHISRYYESVDYISHSDTKEGWINKLYHVGRQWMLNYKHRLVKKQASGKKLLDLGAGTGYFLNHMKKHAYIVSGIEIDARAREFAMKHFDIALEAPDKLSEIPDGSFDVITLWHVLEHLHDLHDSMNHFARLLTDQGRLIMALPNRNARDAQYYRSFWAGYDVPRHLWHFTPKNVIDLADQHGLQLEVIHYLPLDPFYNAMLSEKYKQTRLGLLWGGWHGFTAWISGCLNHKKASSPVYVFRIA